MSPAEEAQAPLAAAVACLRGAAKLVHAARGEHQVGQRDRGEEAAIQIQNVQHSAETNVYFSANQLTLYLSYIR